MTLDAGIGANSASGSYDIDNSCKFEIDNAEWLTRTPSANGDRQKFTISLWCKRNEIGSTYMTLAGAQPSSSYSNANTFQFAFLPNGKIGLGLQTYWVLQSKRVFRDTAAWYHIVVRVDTTQASASNRVRIYINGEEETEWTTDARSNIAQNNLLGWNHVTRHQIGTLIQNSWKFSGYIAEFHNIDGQSLAPTAFGKFNLDGMWEAKQATAGAYGTNGFYLDFENASDLGEDKSGNNHDWTLNNLAAADQAIDSPTNNYCVLNNNAKTNGNIIAEQGGTYVDVDGGSGWVSMLATHGVASGKWYWEGWYENTSDAVYVFWGICAANDPWIPHRSGGYYLGNVATGGSLGWYGLNGQVYNGTGSWPGITYNAKLMFALDCDNGKLYYGSNGTWGNSSNPATNSNGINYVSAMSGINPADEFVIPALSVYQGCRARINFGGHVPQGGGFSIASAASDANGYGTFEYAPPSGYYTICTKNIAEYG